MDEPPERGSQEAKCHADDSMSIHWTLNMRRKCNRFFGSSSASLKRQAASATRNGDKYLSLDGQDERSKIELSHTTNSSTILKHQQSQQNLNDAMRLQVPQLVEQQQQQQDAACSITVQRGIKQRWPIKTIKSHQESNVSNDPPIIKTTSTTNLNREPKEELVEPALSERSGSGGSMLSASSSLLSQLLNSSLNQLIEIDTESNLALDTRDLLFRCSDRPSGVTSSARRALRRSRLIREQDSSSASSLSDNRAPPPPVAPYVDECGPNSLQRAPLIDNQSEEHPQPQPPQQHDSLLEVSQHQPAPHQLPAGTECCDFQCCPVCLAYDNQQHLVALARGAMEERCQLVGPTESRPILPPHRPPVGSSHTFSSSSSCESLGSSASSCAVRVTATDSSDSDLNAQAKKSLKKQECLAVEDLKIVAEVETEQDEDKFCGSGLQLDRKQLLAAPLFTGPQLVLASLSGEPAPLFGLDPRQLRPTAAPHTLEEPAPEGQQVSRDQLTEDQVSVVEARAKLARVVEWSRSGSPMSGASLGVELSRAVKLHPAAEPIYDVPTQEALAATGRASLSPDQKYPAPRNISQYTHASRLHSLHVASAEPARNAKWLAQAIGPKPMVEQAAASSGRPTPNRHQVRLVERSQVRRWRTTPGAQQVGAQSQPKATLVASAAESSGSLSRLATRGSSQHTDAARQLQVAAASDCQSLASSTVCCPICCHSDSVASCIRCNRRPSGHVYTRRSRRHKRPANTSKAATSRRRRRPGRRTCCSCCSCFSSAASSYQDKDYYDHDDDDEPSSLTREYLRRHRSKQYSSHSRHARTHGRSTREPAPVRESLITEPGSASALTLRWTTRPPRRHTHSHRRRRRMGCGTLRGQLVCGADGLEPVEPLINGRHAAHRNQIGELLGSHRQKAAHHRPASGGRRQQEARLMATQSVPVGDLESAQVGARRAARSTNYEGSPAPQVGLEPPETGQHLHSSRNAAKLLASEQTPSSGGAHRQRINEEEEAAIVAPETARHAKANYLRHAASRRHPRLKPAWINGSRVGSGSQHRAHRNHLLVSGPQRSDKYRRRLNGDGHHEFTCHDCCLRGRYSCAASRWSRTGQRRRRPDAHLSSGGAGKLSRNTRRKLEQRAIEQLESAGLSPAVRQFNRHSDAQPFKYQQHQHHIQHQQQAAAYLIRAQRILNEERRRRKRSNLLKRYPLASFGGCFGRRLSSGSSVSFKSGHSSAQPMNMATTNCCPKHKNLRQAGQLQSDKFQSRATLNLMRSMQKALIASSNYTSHQPLDLNTRQLNSNLTQNTSNLGPQIDRRLMDKFLVKTLATADRRKISPSNNKRCQCNHCSLVQLLIRQDFETKIRKRILSYKLAGKQYPHHRQHRQLPLKRY